MSITEPSVFQQFDVNSSPRSMIKDIGIPWYLINPFRARYVNSSAVIDIMQGNKCVYFLSLPTMTSTESYDC
jgi:hypothetical protein